MKSVFFTFVGPTDLLFSVVVTYPLFSFGLLSHNLFSLFRFPSHCPRVTPGHPETRQPSRGGVSVGDARVRPVAQGGVRPEPRIPREEVRQG